MKTEGKITRSRGLLQRILLGNKAPLIVIAIMIILSFASPYFLTTNNLLNVVRQACVITILSVGFTLVIASRHFDMSIGMMMGLLGMILAKLMKDANMPVLPAIMITLLFGMGFGLLNALIITKFNINPFVATLATQSVFQGATYLISGLVPVTDLPESFIFLGQGSWLGIPVPVYIMLLVCAAAFVLMKYTKLGRHIIAVGGNPEAARASGINLNKTRYLVFMITGLLAAVAAMVMTARSASAQVSAGSTLIMDAVAAVVIGGTSLEGGHANIWGTLFGCLVVGIVNNGLNLLGVNANWQIISKGLLILFAVILDVTTTRYYEKRLNRGSVKA
jgi:ribose/xylose/arabinose/galactoside ABC-type transport system permease subunit